MSVRIPGGGILQRSRGDRSLNLCVKVPAIYRGEITTADFEDVEVIIDFTRETRHYHHSPTEEDDTINDIAVSREVVEANLAEYTREGYRITETVEQIMQRAEAMARHKWENQ